jgi:hypothetical protein
MSKKKSRRAESTTPASTAVMAEPAVTGITTASSLPVDRPVIKAPRSEESFLTTPAGRFFHRLFRICSSLQLAISLLSLFTMSLIVATLLEMRCNAQIAGQLVYKAWWFTVLLFLLGTNILCAALKKMDSKKLAEMRWPWKKYQTGFLVTHLGLITLVFGGLLTALGGEEGQIQMIDGDNQVIRERSGYSQTTDTLFLADQHKLIVTRIPIQKGDSGQVRLIEETIRTGELPKELQKRGAQSWVYDISPGGLPWRDEEGYRSNLSWPLRFLHRLSSPFPGKSYSLGDGRLKVVNYLPWTEQWDHATAKSADSAGAFPAVQLRVESKLFSPAAEFWVDGLPSRVDADPEKLTLILQDNIRRNLENTDHLRASQPGRMSPRLNIAFDFLSAGSAEQVNEFLVPPPSRKMGSLGQLVLFLGPEKKPVRIPVNPDELGKRRKLEGTDFTLELIRAGNLLKELPFEKEVRAVMEEHAGEIGEYPYVRFKLAAGDVEEEMLVCSRIPNLPLSQSPGKFSADMTGFYHYPDGLSGRKNLHGGVQFLFVPGGKTYFRAFGAEGMLSDEGEEVDLANEGLTQVLPWRDAARTTFRSIGYFPQASPERGASTLKPRNLDRLGARMPPQYSPALKGVIEVNGQEYPFETRMAMRKSDRPALIFAGKNHADTSDIFLIRYTPAVRKLDFDVALHRVRDTKDPGTDRSGSYESDITISWKENEKTLEKRVLLYMNHTYDFGGYRLFQANYEETDFDCSDKELEMERKANVTGITLARDPGLHVKYAGFVIVVLGIFTMFYMKAYFFAPRRGGANAPASTEVT